MTPENRFEPSRFFKPVKPLEDPHYEAELANIRARGNQLINPFWVLSRIVDVEFTPEGRRTVLAKLRASKYAQEIGFEKTARGLKFHAKNAGALVLAMEEIYFGTDIFVGALTKQSQHEADESWKPYREWFRQSLIR